MITIKIQDWHEKRSSINDVQIVKNIHGYVNDEIKIKLLLLLQTTIKQNDLREVLLSVDFQSKEILNLCIRLMEKLDNDGSLKTFVIDWDDIHFNKFLICYDNNCSYKLGDFMENVTKIGDPFFRLLKNNTKEIAYNKNIHSILDSLKHNRFSYLRSFLVHNVVFPNEKSFNFNNLRPIHIEERRRNVEKINHHQCKLL